MDKLKSLLGTIAPWIAGSFGTPAAGAAVKLICDALGLDATTAKPETLAAAIQVATPDQLLALKAADNGHAEFMAKLGYDSLASLETTAAADRDSARKMQIAQPSHWPGVLSAVTTAAVVGVIAARIAGLAIPDDPTTVQLIGSLTTGWGMALSYWLGTTRNSGNKDVLLAQSQPAGGQNG